MSGILLRAPRRELARRVSGGTEFALYWSADDGTSIEIHSPESDVTIEFTVPGEDALDAFYHPFAHLVRTRDRGL